MLQIVSAKQVDIKCKICDVIKDKQVPLLNCKHYICPPCYVSMRSHKIDDCILCNKKMKRRC